ncbi:hypothetical protein QQ045_032872 [Rhodiola kirilowii]
MSTVVYRSRLESQLIESRTLKLKLSSPKVVFSQSLEMALQSCVIDCDSKKLESPNLGGWSCLQTLPNATPCEKLQAPYVHPATKHYSSWWLSEKSLNLCTENLGSETGSEFIENSIFSSPACSTTENKVQVKREQRQPRNRQAPERKKELPPPLTTLRGADSLQVRPHRENGRLILKATTTPPSSGRCFQVDRSNGRLRLTLTGGSPISSKESEQNEDDKRTNKEDNKDGKTEKSPEIACSSYEDENSSMDVGRVEMMKNIMWDEQRTAASSSCCCRCNESHKKKNNNNAKKKGMMTSMVKVEPHFLVASS